MKLKNECGGTEIIIQRRQAGRLARLVLVLSAAASACSPDMFQQPSYRPDTPSRFFPDERANRPVVQGAVAQRDSRAAAVRGPLTRQTLDRGRERYDVFCSPCHGRIGNGEGIVVQRGFSRPPSFHIDRLRAAPDDHYYAVISEGFGRMWSYAARIDPADRWAIVPYVRALQLSQSAAPSDVPDAELQKLLRTKP